MNIFSCEHCEGSGYVDPKYPMAEEEPCPYCNCGKKPKNERSEAEMHLCMTCKFANWKRTKSGALHPSGDGECTYDVAEPKMPACMYNMGSFNILGGRISRKKPIRKCSTYDVT